MGNFLSEVQPGKELIILKGVSKILSHLIDLRHPSDALSRGGKTNVMGGTNEHNAKNYTVTLNVFQMTINR